MPERTSEGLEDSRTPDARLAEALGFTVESALIRSVRREPRMWAEALFPIILPAVRMAVAAALRDAVQTLNQVLEQGLSLKSWRWRVESWRTGKRYAEVVLLRTLVYRVEQVLLIDRKTGLLLSSAAAPSAVTQDTELLSAMLTAIQDFVHESFDVENSADIRELHVSDFSLWIEQGPRAAIAAAVRGNAPVELRETLRAAIDLVHQEFEVELRQFEGDSRPFERSRSILEGCLQSRYQSPGKTSSRKAVVCMASLAALAMLWFGFRIYQGRRWDRALTALQTVPGILVTKGGRQGGSYFIDGFRDPLAESPKDVLVRRGIDVQNVALRFRPFLSLDPNLTLERARISLQPPEGASLALDQDVLSIRGTAPHEWILRTKNAAAQLRMWGIREVRTADLRDRDLEALRTRIEGQSILFPKDSSEVGGKQAEAARLVAAQALQWIRSALDIGMVPEVRVIGYTDASGTHQRNQVLGEERAAHVAALLRAASVPQETLQVEGKEDSAPGMETDSLQRTVRFQLLLRPRDEERRGAH